MGAEAIKDLLMKIDIDELVEDLRVRMREETSQQKKLKFSKTAQGREFVPAFGQ
jgi:DNA-directed RNA polymerase subunit beta'